MSGLPITGARRLGMLFYQVNGRNSRCVWLSVCQSPCVCEDDVLRRTYLHFPQANYQKHPGCGPQLRSRWSVELSNPASARIAARGLPSKLVPCCGNQPYCSCHGKQAPSPAVLCRQCFKAPGAQHSDDAQMPPTSAGAVKPLQPGRELTVQPLQICGCSLHTAELLPYFSPPPSRPLPPLLAPSLLVTPSSLLS